MRFAAVVADPDDPKVGGFADFGLVDVTDPAQHSKVFGLHDASTRTPATSSGTAQTVVTADLTNPLVDGHSYQVRAIASDGTTDSGVGAPCQFGYDGQAPRQPTVTLAEQQPKVGEKLHFTVTATEPKPALGAASGFGHFGYAVDSSVYLDDDGGTHVVAAGTRYTHTATITMTEQAWGAHYLYVDALDRAGNVSGTTRYQFYVADK